MVRKVAGLAVVAGLLGLGWVYGLPLLTGSRTVDLPLTAAAVQGELRVTVTERGELSSVDETVVECEVEGRDAKLLTILPEGTRVSQGDVVATLDTDEQVKALNEQRVKVEVAETKVKTCAADVIQAKSKQGTENANAEKKLILAKIALEKYTDAEGEYVKEWEKLKGAVALAEQGLQDAEQELAFYREQVRKGFGQLTDVTSREIGVEQKRNVLNSARAELLVLEKFTKKEKTTQLEFEATDAEREVERTKVAQQSLVEKAESELKNAESTAAIERETLARIQQQIDRSTIKAPSDGIVVYANARPWDDAARIRPGALLYNRQPIFSLPDLSRMKVKMKIHETLVKKVGLDMSAEVTIDALPGVAISGRVLKIATIAQSEGWRGGGVKQYETEIELQDLPTNAGLKPGMTAEVKILVKVLPNALQVPVSAVAEYAKARVVYVVADGQITRREVQVGESSEQFVQILSGLTEGEQVALDARTRAAADLKEVAPEVTASETPASPPSPSTAGAP